MQGMDKPLHFIAVLYIYDNLVKWLYRPYFLKWYGRKEKQINSPITKTIILWIYNTSVKIYRAKS